MANKISTIDLTASLEATAEMLTEDYDDVPMEAESPDRKAIHMDMPDDDYFVHPKAKIRHARTLWRDSTPESPLYDRRRPKGGKHIQCFTLSDDAKAYIYDAPGLDGVVWGELRGAVTDTFLGISTDANDLIRRARSLDLDHLVLDA